MTADTTQRDASPAVAQDDPLALEKQVCFALVVAGRSVLGVYRPILEEFGLTHPQYLVMLALWERSPRTAKELSSLLQLDPGTLSPMLKRLAAAGLVTRGRNATDERRLDVDLTVAGRALRERALSVPPAVMQRLDMSEPQLRELHSALTSVIAAAGAADGGVR